MKKTITFLAKAYKFLACSKPMYLTFLFSGAFLLNSVLGNAQQLIHHYTFNNTYSDEFGGSDMIPNGGTLTTTAYIFGSGQGLDVSGVIDEYNYSIELRFTPTNTSTWNEWSKILDFGDSAYDEGLYNFSGQLEFYTNRNGNSEHLAIGTSIVFTEDTPVTVLLTRDGNSKEVRGYINGCEQWAFTDDDQFATFTGPGNILRVFIDDFEVPDENQDGSLDYLKIYSGPILPNNDNSDCPSCELGDQQLIHHYNFNNTYSDEFGGSDMMPNGGTLTETAYIFGEGEGPSISGVIDEYNYSIELRFTPAYISGYWKILDFGDRAYDEGLYNNNGHLEFWPVAVGPFDVFSEGTPITVLVTRNGCTDEVRVCVDGVVQLVFTDDDLLATLTGPGNILHILIDDSGGEDPSGSLDYVKIYSGPVTSDPDCNGCIEPQITCPTEASVACDESNEPAETGIATVIDGCGDVIITFVDNTTPGSSDDNYTITRTWTATDENGNTASCDQTITVTDDEAPVITTVPVEMEFVIWPPNHQYETFTLEDFIVSVADNCAGDISLEDVTILSATSDEPENSEGTGDGNTLNDMIIAADCQSIQLRRERDGGSNGRVYTINLAVDDGNGNFGTATAQVEVPHSNNGTAIDDGPAYEVECNKSSFVSFIGSDVQLVNYPNPFNRSTTITFTLTETANTTLKVYDSFGREVATLFNGMAESGQQYILNFSSGNLSKGIYVYHLQNGNKVSVIKKMILVK